MNKKKILLTGSSGFIGKNIMSFLGNNYDIIEVNRSSNYNINDLNSLLNIKKVDIVIHAAAETFIPESFKNPYRFYQFNINASLNIAEYCRIKKVKKLIYLNTYPYGKPKYNPIDEKHETSPHSPYTESKLISEKILFSYLDQKISTTSLRIFNPYGYFQKDDFLIPTILKQALKNDTIKIRDVRPKRDYLHIEDLITLLIKIIHSNNAQGIYNVGYGKSYSINEIVEVIEKILHKKLKIHSTEIPRSNEVLDCFADIKKVKNKFKWSPNIDLKNGINKYIDWIKNNK